MLAVMLCGGAIKRVAETAALSSIAMSPLVTSLPAGLAATAAPNHYNIASSSASVSPAASVVGIEPTAADWVEAFW